MNLNPIGRCKALEFIMNASRHFAVAVILPVVCATVAVPQTVTFSSRQDGNLVSAGTSVTGPNYNANLNLSPYISEQGGRRLHRELVDRNLWGAHTGCSGVRFAHNSTATSAAAHRGDEHNRHRASRRNQAVAGARAVR